MAIGKIEAIKRFFGSVRPVTNEELLALRRADKTSFDELAEGAAKALGETISTGGS